MSEHTSAMRAAAQAQAEPVQTTHEQDASSLALKITERLVYSYRLRPAAVAAACDRDIDRSGNLLGWIRKAAATLPAQSTNDKNGDS